MSIWPTLLDVGRAFIAVIAVVLILKIVRRLLLGRAGPRSISYRYIPFIGGKDAILVLDVNGPILDDPRTAPPYLRKSASFGAELYDALEAAANNATIRGVVMKYATPGGTPSGSDLIARGIELCRQKKPVYVHVSPLSASGGVWSMISADRIVAAPESYVGSIGVVGPSLVRYKDFTEIGEGGLFGGHVRAKQVTVETMSRGTGKNFGNPFSDVDEATRKHYNRFLDRMYSRFVHRVAQLRKLTPETVRAMGAFVFDAGEALERGLIDGVGSFSDTVAQLAQKLELKPDDFRLVWTKKSYGGAMAAFRAKLDGGTPPAGTGISVTGYLRQQPFLMISSMFLGRDG